MTGKVCGFVKVMSGGAPFKQIAEVPLIVAVGNGRTVTGVDAGTEGPLHPFATTLTVADPVNEGLQVTVPAVPVPDIVLPAPVTDHV
jgi:hypothetical protein